MQSEIEPFTAWAGKGGDESIHDKNYVKSKLINIQNSFGPPAKETFATKILEMASREPRKYGVVLFQNGVSKTTLGSPQEKKKFACPQKNVE